MSMAAVVLGMPPVKRTGRYVLYGLVALSVVGFWLLGYAFTPF